MALSLFRCPHCAGTFQVEARAKDQQVHCTHCRGLVTIAGTPGGASSAPVRSAAGGTTTQVQPAQGRAAATRAPAAPARMPSIQELEPDSPLLPERPTAVPTIAPLTTPVADLSIHEVLKHGRAHRVSDIHVAPGAPVLFRIARKLVPATTVPLTSKQSERLSLELLTEAQRQQFHATGDYDFMAIDDYGRYRVNVGYFDGDIGTVIRILAQRPKTLAELRVPDVIRDLAAATKGLVLLTGSASQGKTTTMTAIIDDINSNSARHVITIEDPIEYLHTNKKGLVRQRQVGRD
ncbi:MAG TPA: ATPase, T2SS/T4P/T4SS family, partial [Pirellulales bacterium]|nr:ATPase, T2SS/T4P/T4SS family [Pirellulales bacterium]